MQIRRLRAEDAAVRRYVDECWLPYQHELTEQVESRAFDEDSEREAVVEWLVDKLESPETRLWVALEDAEERTGSFAECDGTVAGFVIGSLSTPPSEFEWPDRIEIHDMWVEADYRGGGLAQDLLERVCQQAREDGCPELSVNLDIDNERAVAFVEKLGFEVQGYRMTAPLSAVPLEPAENGSPPDDLRQPQFRRLRIDEDVMHRFVDECWRPFWRDLGDAVGTDFLSADIDRNALVEGLLESYDVPDRRCWIALDGTDTVAQGLGETDATFAGWLNAGLEPTEKFLDPPERLFIGNLYVKPPYRGSRLADSLVARGLQYAQEEGVEELVLGVEADNGRAMAYYEKLGFEPLRQRMTVPVGDVSL